MTVKINPTRTQMLKYVVEYMLAHLHESIWLDIYQTRSLVQIEAAMGKKTKTLFGAMDMVRYTFGPKKAKTAA